MHLMLFYSNQKVLILCFDVESGQTFWDITAWKDEQTERDEG